MSSLIRQFHYQMIGCGLLCFIVSIGAAGQNRPAASASVIDQEIIKNLDFYENLEILETAEPEELENFTEEL